MKLKSLLFLSISLFMILSANAQWLNKSFSFGGNVRQYRVYVPAAYSATTPVPLVMTLHGLSDNMTNFSTIGMDAIADTANFIVVVPQAMTDALINTTAWNSGAGLLGYYPNANIDDVGFLSALMDTIHAHYAIDTRRIYVCGFSMGAYMTERLGCTLSNKIAAIASMAGTFGSGFTSCNPARAISVAHFHGTNDQTVPYYNNNSGIDADSLVSFWRIRNNCSSTPVHTTLPDIANDGYTVDHYVYGNGTQNTVVELFKVNGADHEWLSLPTNDISYSLEAWKFFSRYQLPTGTGVAETVHSAAISIYPNPAKDKIRINVPSSYTGELSFRLYSTTGQMLSDKKIGKNEDVSLSGLSNGLYWVRIEGDKISYSQKLMVEN